MQRHRPRQRGFTLLELLVVLMIISIAMVSVGISLRGSGADSLQVEAQRLIAHLEAARIESQSLGVRVEWHTTEAGYEIRGLNEVQNYEWLRPETQSSTTTLLLGPEPILAAQSLTLSRPEESIAVGSDGVKPFAILLP